MTAGYCKVRKIYTLDVSYAVLTNAVRGTEYRERERALGVPE